MSSSVPEKEYWRSDKPQAEAMVPNMSFLSKLKLSAAMYCNSRRVGWNSHVKGDPGYRAPNTKTNFLIKQGKSLLVCFTVIDPFNM